MPVPNSDLLSDIVRVFVLIFLIIVGIGGTVALLDLVVAAVNTLKTEGKKLAGKYPDALGTLDMAANFDVSKLHTYFDDPNDMIIMLLTQMLKGDPDLMIERIDTGLAVLAKIQSLWPTIKVDLGLAGASSIASRPLPPHADPKVIQS